MMFLMKFWGVLVTWPHLRKVGSCCRRYPFMSCNKNWFYLAAKLLFRSSGFSLLNVHTIFTHVKVCRFWKPLHCHFLSVYWHKTLVLLKVPTIVFEVPNLFSSFSLNTFWICWSDTKKVFNPVHEFWQNSNMSSEQIPATPRLFLWEYGLPFLLWHCLWKKSESGQIMVATDSMAAFCFIVPPIWHQMVLSREQLKKCKEAAGCQKSSLWCPKLSKFCRHLYWCRHPSVK